MADKRKKKTPHDTKEIHHKQPKARTVTANSGGVSQATNARKGENLVQSILSFP
ncbi:MULTISPECIES: hypothetical protein [unclassified Sphingobacterium]|uniref:hypothetical protein n=1 Tax=unclassified Sphingobacterium TaxID=2609468 RepID=UPI0025E4BC8D|nr:MULTISPECIES: hypothetical protein [unclassified Sphingobacterium]